MTDSDAIDWERLAAAARAVRDNAYAPYSNFPVGAALLAEDDTIHVGVNVENIAYPSGQCAEAGALGALVAGGAGCVRAVAVAGSLHDFTWPCGNCRQKLVELAVPDCPVISIAGDRRAGPVALESLLPATLVTLTGSEPAE